MRSGREIVAIGAWIRRWWAIVAESLPIVIRIIAGYHNAHTQLSEIDAKKLLTGTHGRDHEQMHGIHRVIAGDIAREQKLHDRAEGLDRVGRERRSKLVLVEGQSLIDVQLAAVFEAAKQPASQIVIHALIIVP